MKLFKQIFPLKKSLRRKLKLVCFAFIFFLALLQTSFATQHESLADYVKTALEQNHEIRAAHSQWEAAKEKIRQAGSFPDPRLGAEYFLQPVETRTGPQEAAISISQSIPWPGRLASEKKNQEHESEVARENYLATRLSVIRKIKETFLEYGYLGQAKQVTKNILELMQYLEKIARTNYTSGKASYADILKIQIEIDKLKNKQQMLDDKTSPVRAQLNSLIGEERLTPRPQPDLVPLISLSQDDEKIYTLSRQHSPKIMVAKHMIEKSKTSLKLANQAYYPDLSLSVKTIFTGEAEFGSPPDSGNDPVIAGMTITIPLFSEKRNGAIAEKQSTLEASRNMFQQTVIDIEAQIEMALFRYREALRLQDLYKNDLIPKVRQELDVALEAFQGGQSSIQELIDTEKDWFTFELAQVRSQADMAIQVAILEELTGSTLADWYQKI